MSIPTNRRILLIDDMPSIHDDFHEQLWRIDPRLQVVICTAYAREMPAPMGHVGQRSQPEGAMADRRI